MSFITVIWSMVAAACLTLALVHLMAWNKSRFLDANVMFFLAALSVAGLAGTELAMMRAQTPTEYGAALRWAHVPVWGVILSLVGFVRFYLRAGRMWLAWTACGLRTLSLVLNFVLTPNINYREITGIRRIVFLGEPTSLAVGTPSAWTLLAQASLWIFVLFVVDAAITVWRRGDRRRALVVGGSIILFAFGGATQSMLALWGVIQAPMTPSVFYLGIVVAMAHELGTDINRSVQLAEDLRASESALRESEHRLDLVAGVAELAIWSWDIDGDDVWITDAGRRLLGLAEGERLTLSGFLDALHPDDRTRVREALTRQLQGGGDFDGEYRVVLRDGRMRWISTRGRTEFGAEGRPVRLRGISFDVTRSKQAEERFQLVVEAAPNAMIMSDEGGQVVLVNKRAEEIFGYARAELIGRSIESLIPEAFRRRHRGHRQTNAAAPQARPMAEGRELFARRKDGGKVPVEIGISPIRTAKGNMVLAAVVDITSRREAEREAAQQRNELAHLSRVTMLGELSGSMAHELNQPLTAILSNAQAALRFLAHDPIDLDEVRGILTDIVEENKRAGEVIRRLRVLFRKGEVQFEPLDLNEAIDEVLKLLQSDLVNHNVAVHRELAEDLPALLGDRVQLQQVLINLLINGCDAMADTEPAHRQLSVRTERENGECVTVSVADHGRGIAADQMKTVFEPFVTTKSTGMGLGLAVCRTIITAHGGKLWAENNPDAGARFAFTLPTRRKGSNGHG